MATPESALKLSSSDFALPDRATDAIDGGKMRCAGLELTRLCNDKVTRASQQVGLSQDLLPLILQNLKNILLKEKDGATFSWKHAFSLLLVVNRVFYESAADLLWQEMHRLEPVFRLLPWFTTPYKGIGEYHYSGSDDWAAFNRYARRIRVLEMRDSASSVRIPSPWCMELMNLPGRPAGPFFPRLEAITMTDDSGECPNLLFILVNSALQFLVFEAQNPISHANTIAILPSLPFVCPQLNTLTYSGLDKDSVGLRLSRLTNLTRLSMILMWQSDPQFWGCILKLPLLQILMIGTEPPAARMLEPPSKEKAKDHGCLRHLTVLRVLTSLHEHCHIARILRPRRLATLNLVAVADESGIRDIEAIYLCLEMYISSNQTLSEVTLSFVEVNVQPRPLTQVRWPVTQTACEGFLSALEGSKTIRTLSIDDIPMDLAMTLAPKLLQGIARWEHITSLCFRTQLQDTAPQAPNLPLTPPFPGLSFLASTIWKHHPKLITLEYHFDKALVEEEDLSDSLDVCNDALGSGAAADRYPADHHRLHRLCINTGSTSSEAVELTLSVTRKVRIATFLDRLFPGLQSVEGSAKEVWSEIDILVKSYQGRRARFEI